MKPAEIHEHIIDHLERIYENPDAFLKALNDLTFQHLVHVDQDESLIDWERIQDLTDMIWEIKAKNI